LGVFEFVEVSGFSVFVSAIERSLLALEHTPALCCTVCVLALDRLQLRASTHQTQIDAHVQFLDARAQCALTIDGTSIVIEHTSKLLHSCTLTLDHTLPALEHISAVNSNKPKAAKYSIFDFFLVYCYFSSIVYFVVCVFYLLLLNFCK
jgi:hypothetical protein